jgi:hypothetical protein
MWQLKAIDMALAGGEEAREIDAAQWKRIAHVAECANCQAGHRWAIGMAAGYAVIDCSLPDQVAAVCEAAEKVVKSTEDHRRRRAASVGASEVVENDPEQAPPAMMVKQTVTQTRLQKITNWLRRK